MLLIIILIYSNTTPVNSQEHCCVLKHKNSYRTPQSPKVPTTKSKQKIKKKRNKKNGGKKQREGTFL